MVSVNSVQVHVVQRVTPQFHFLIEEVHKEIGDSEKSLLAELVIMTLTAINSLLRSPNRYTRTASLQAVVRPLLQNKESMWLMKLYNISLMVLKTRTIGRKTYFWWNKGLNESISTLFLMSFDLIYNYVYLEETSKTMMNIKTWINFWKPLYIN